MTATAPQGGVVAAVATLAVRPQGKARATLPKRLKAAVAAGRGLPLKLFAPIAGTRFTVVLSGPKASGAGKQRLLKKVKSAKALGTTVLRLRIPPARAAAFLADRSVLALEVKAAVPGAKKPLRIRRTLTLK